jgi:excisionase family DNA binding protein
MSATDNLTDGHAVRLDNRLLTAAEVADLFQIPTSTVYELARQGRLPSLRIGRAIRFSQNDLERHLADVREGCP